jgi:DNA-binding beta-propeller fold protein YncE
LAIINPNQKVRFNQIVESRHTVTSLIWPSTAGADERIDQDMANQDDHVVTLKTPGLHVFVCKLHPYMLGAVIVDDNKTNGLDIGEQLTLLGPTAAGQVTFPSNSNLGLRLLRAFFVVTSPSNWKDYTKVGIDYLPEYPKVDVNVGSAITPIVVPLDTTIRNALDKDANGDPVKIPAQQVKPGTPGVGEVWVDTQYELTNLKGDKFPGTISIVDVSAADPADNWKVRKKISLPGQKMNNGHNMWASHDQSQIYQTEWHGKSLFVLDRVKGTLLQELEIGHDPAHVMTRVDTEQVHVTLNGEDGVVELNRQLGPLPPLAIHRVISMQDPHNLSKPTQPHAHWMGHDGLTMATPNANSADSSLFRFDLDQVVSKIPTGALPIAVGMMPDSSKYYVSNYLGHTVSAIKMNGQNPATFITDINLLQNYHADTGVIDQGTNHGAIGGLPIQTPVSPDGKFVITGNTLTATISIIDTATDTLVKSIACDPGCHGVNFGAKLGGGYYAYVTSKFANRLIVLDYNPANDGDVNDVKNNAKIAGWVVLDDNTAPIIDDPVGVTGNNGMGGQGVLPLPIVYNGWVQKLPVPLPAGLTGLNAKQLNPFP